MSDLIQVIHTGKFNEENTTAEIEAEFEDYTFSSFVDVDVELDRKAEPELGLKNEYIQYGFDFFNIKIIDDMSQEIGLSNSEMDMVKYEIENYLEKLVHDF